MGKNKARDREKGGPKKSPRFFSYLHDNDYATALTISEKGCISVYRKNKYLQMCLEDEADPLPVEQVHQAHSDHLLCHVDPAETDIPHFHHQFQTSLNATMLAKYLSFLMPCKSLLHSFFPVFSPQLIKRITEAYEAFLKQDLDKDWVISDLPAYASNNRMLGTITEHHHHLFANKSNFFESGTNSRFILTLISSLLTVLALSMVIMNACDKTPREPIEEKPRGLRR